MTTPERTMNCRVMGVLIGMASGWDSFADNGIMFLDFQPADWTGDHLAGNTVCVDFDDGTCTVWNDNNKEREISSADFLALLMKAPKP